MTNNNLQDERQTALDMAIDALGGEGRGNPVDLGAICILQDLKDAPASAEQATTTDYQEVLADHRRLVRELDVLLNGEEGAAKQASLCDLVAQVKHKRWKLVSAEQAEPVATKLASDPYDDRNGSWFSLEDIEKLKSLPPGAKLYDRPALEVQTNRMVDRFLGWPLPKDFAPDAGVRFEPTELQRSGVHPWPTGTNLLHAEQAREMFEYVLEGAARPTSAVVEALNYYANPDNYLTERRDSSGCLYYECIDGVAAIAEDALALIPPEADQPNFQGRVAPWMQQCFGPVIAADIEERNHRFLEEALELVQACGCSQLEAHQLVQYVYGRPTGERSQEVGGVMVTLAALCLAQNLDMHIAAETELARIMQPEIMEKIRAKQAAKPKHSPLPEQPAAKNEAQALDEQAKDAELLDWLDATNRPFRMGWKVSSAPAGNVVVQSMIFVGGEPTSIMAAIADERAKRGG